MPRVDEIDYYSKLLASLIISAARAQTGVALLKAHDDLAVAFSEMFTLLSHDAGALPVPLPFLEPPLEPTQ